MIYVSHRLDEVFEIADRMVILRDGRVVGERVVSETSPEEAILLIVGRAFAGIQTSVAARRSGQARVRRVTRTAVRSTAASDPAKWSGSSVCAALAGIRWPRPVRPCADHRTDDCSSTGARLLRRLRARRWISGSISCVPIALRNPSFPPFDPENLFLNPVAAGHTLVS